MDALRTAKGAGVLGVMLLAALVGSVIVISVSMPLLFVWRAGFHYWTDLVKKQWFILTVLLLEKVGGIKIYVYGSDRLRDEHALVLSNHKTRIDWMMQWMFFARCPGRVLSKLRIVLKAPLKKLPIFGWSMNTFRFIFLTRDWKHDQGTIQKACKYAKERNDSGTYLIYPEGTDLSKSSLEKSNEYAKSKGLPVLDHVLYPKKTGTYFLQKCLRGQLDAVWDLTVAYKDRVPGERPNETLLAQGKYPQEVHILFKRIPIADFPQDEKEQGDWLEKGFIRRNDEIQKFYDDGHSFAGTAPRFPCALSMPRSLACLAYWTTTAYCTYCIVTTSLVYVAAVALIAWILGGSRVSELIN